MTISKKNMENIQFIHQYHIDHGTFRMTGPENQYYRNWMTDHRMRHRKGVLSREMENALDAIGFDWHPFETMQKH